MFGRKAKNPAEQGTDRRQVNRGGAPSPAFSYYTSRTSEVSRERTPGRQETAQKTEQGRKKRRLFSAGLSFWLLLLVAAVCLLKVLWLSTDPKVIVVGASAVSARYVQSADTYAAAAHKLLAGSITNRTKLTVNLNGVAAQLQKQFPELQTVSLTVPLASSRPIVYVQLAQPTAVVQTAQGNYALNASGIVLAPLKTLPPNVPLLVDQSGAAPAPGKQFLPGSTLAFVQTVAYQFDAAHLDASVFVLSSGSPYELDARLSGQTYTIRFNLEADATVQSGAAIATVQQLGDTVPSAYLDVRVPGRVYYK